jgi:hypothetical protein
MDKFGLDNIMEETAKMIKEKSIELYIGLCKVKDTDHGKGRQIFICR